MLSFLLLLPLSQASYVCYTPNKQIWIQMQAAPREYDYKNLYSFLSISISFPMLQHPSSLDLGPCLALYIALRIVLTTHLSDEIHYCIPQPHQNDYENYHAPWPFRGDVCIALRIMPSTDPPPEDIHSYIPAAPLRPPTWPLHIMVILWTCRLFSWNQDTTPLGSLQRRNKTSWSW